MAIKKKEGEDLSKENVAKVISLLEGDEPITKKRACEILKISYNTTRLNKIIEAHKEHEEFSAKRRKELRGKPLTDGDIKTIIESYLSGESLASISEFTFRSTNVIKNVLKRYNVPIRSTGNNYFKALCFEDGTWKEEYEPGDLVFSARYCRPCTIVRFAQLHPQHGNTYSIEFHGEDRFYAYQPAYELADLTEVQKKFDIKLSDMSAEEVRSLLYEAYMKARKMDKK